MHEKINANTGERMHWNTALRCGSVRTSREISETAKSLCLDYLAAVYAPTNRTSARIAQVLG